MRDAKEIWEKMRDPGNRDVRITHDGRSEDIDLSHNSPNTDCDYTFILICHLTLLNLFRPMTFYKCLWQQPCNSYSSLPISEPQDDFVCEGRFNVREYRSPSDDMFLLVNNSTLYVKPRLLGTPKTIHVLLCKWEEMRTGVQFFLCKQFFLCNFSLFWRWSC